MFSRLTTALYNAVDALAPPLPLQEEFVWHWTAVTRFYIDRNSNGKKPIETTGIPGHLNQMSKILEQEERELESESIGPCMEYFLQHKLLDTMSALARADTPPGMKKFILMFVTRLLKNTKQAILPQVSVYLSLQKLVKLCGEILAAPTEREEADFLSVICSKIQADPHMLNCFLVDTGKRRDSDAGAPLSPGASTSSSTQNELQFPILKALLTLLESPDSEIANIAAECMIQCVSIPNDSLAFYAVNHTDMCQRIVKHLTKLYCAIPKTLKAVDIEEAVSSWSGESKNPEAPDVHIALGQRRLLCFFKWLGFIDTTVEMAHPLIVSTLLETLSHDFLQTVLLTDLGENESEEHVLFTTTLVTTCLRNVSSKKIVAVFGSFLLGEEMDPELPGCVGHWPKFILIERCKNPASSIKLVMATLQIFEELLQRPSEQILHSLLLANLVNRGYYDNSAADGNFYDFSDEEPVPCGAPFVDDFEVSPGSSPVSRTFAPTHIHRILNCFLMLLPDEIKSCDTDDSGYDSYIKDAHRQFQECLMLSDEWNWPTEPLGVEDHMIAEDDQSSDSQPEADSSRTVFYEGSFLSMLFDKMENMLEQPYDINLQVTSLISRLALFAHPNLHEYLLNPLIPLAPRARSLFTILLRVVEDIQIAIQRISNFKKQLQLTRSALLNEGDYSTFDNGNVLEALIVIEEFCKELAAVAFVKYHAAS